MIHTTACAVIFIWSAWCVLSPTVHDGVVGKVFYATASVAAFIAVFDRATVQGDQLLIISMAGLALRSVYVDRIMPMMGKDRRCSGATFIPPQYRRWHP